jgi:serine/threonine-protein kinase RsbW
MAYGMPDDGGSPFRMTSAQEYQMTFQGTAHGVRAALIQLAETDLFHALPPDMQQDLEITLGEALNNIAEHAYATRQGLVTLSLQRTQTTVHCLIRDAGAAMPGLVLPKGDLPAINQVDDLPEGGFGWFMIRALTKELRYQRIGAENHLSFDLI